MKCSGPVETLALEIFEAAHVSLLSSVLSQKTPSQSLLSRFLRVWKGTGVITVLFQFKASSQRWFKNPVTVSLCINSTSQQYYLRYTGSKYECS